MDDADQSFTNNKKTEITMRHVIAGPKANILKRESGYEIELAVPGFSKSDFQIRLEGKVLEIAGKRQETEEGQYARREFYLPSFERRFVLADHLRAKDPEARYENGILKIFLPVEPPRRVEVA